MIKNKHIFAFKMDNRLIVFLFVSMLLAFTSCEKDDSENEKEIPTVVAKGLTIKSTGSISVKLEHVFKNTPLLFTPSSFITKAGDTVRFAELKHYLSHITLKKADGSTWDANNFHLINAQQPEDILINNVPAGNYTSMTFMLGVDSINNHTLNHNEPALDPGLGMSWSWATGYIFVRVKGSFGSQQNGFSFDIGGDQHLLTIPFDFSGYQLAKDQVTADIRVDWNEFFENPNTYDLKTQTTAIHTPIEPAISLLTENMANGMFSLKSLR